MRKDGSVPRSGSRRSKYTSSVEGCSAPHEKYPRRFRDHTQSSTGSKDVGLKIIMENLRDHTHTHKKDTVAVFTAHRGQADEQD